jgi:Protein of unknown function DUF115
MKEQLKKVTPIPLWKLGSDTYWWYHNRGRHRLAQVFDSAWATSRRRLEGYRDTHVNERCFILGNGPSLLHTDLSLLRNEFTFGLNRIYLLFPEMGFKTTYLVSVNDLVLEQCAEEIKALEMPKFITWRARRWLSNDPHTIFVDTDYSGPENFTGDVSGRVFEGFTVTYVALQLAYYMGFQEVILVGVDHNFVTQGPANSAVVSNGDDPNHFSTNYFGKGFKWQLPDLEGSERAYRLAKSAYEAEGRIVRDATVGGKLSVFPKIVYGSLFG